MSDKHFNNSPRLNQILAKIQEAPCSQDELAIEFDVSVQTIRRDFATLKQNQLINVKSGVAYIDNPTSLVNTDFTTRQSKYMPEKEAVAQAIARDIPDGSTIFLTVGTTTEQVAQALLKKKELTVITSSIRVANILCESDNIDVLVPSGKIRKNNGGIIGSTVVEDINQFHVDYTVTSVGAITEDGIALEYNIDDVAIARTMIGQSRKLIIAIDHSKYTSNASVVLCKPDLIDAIYCDAEPPAKLANIFADHGVEYHHVTLK
ncbi:DeoR/GlpR family DNA-binding transcription regulator [Vibrio rhodolitus]|uniref:DeoR/GlpR family DNA-binding transcription regulator n=1 Tax=Vibrio rhodolitus TaxID=2231649 RepID=UPI000E0B74A2|nr:DeoR/GlpR family DNA-binding transcription regulator [Vibrio rhodolitus]